MLQFLRSPRRVLGSICGIGLLCLCYMVLYAYWNAPRLKCERVDESTIDFHLIRAKVSGLGSIYSCWDCPDEPENQKIDCRQLLDQLNSPEFMRDYRHALTARYPSLSELFTGTTEDRLVFQCDRSKHSYPKDDALFLRGIYSCHYCVPTPAYAWCCWLQEHLPFMPDRAKLAQDADERNRDAIDILSIQVRRAFPELHRMD
jgi:hypothetical protein